MKLQVGVSRVACGLLLGVAAGGCASSKQDVGWSGPAEEAPLVVERWQYDGQPARNVKTPHYAIHTTIADNRVVNETAQVMEGAYQQYLKMVPGLKVSDRPMDCFVFANRSEWNRFTLTNAGPAAETYMKIARGGYALRDAYVAYYLGNLSTYSVAAHEGWHQFCARNFKGRVPPFLEEGIATMFEGVSMEGPHGLPQWNFAVNLNRAVKLREAVQERQLWPLEQLVTLHAGMVVGEGYEKVDAFYAQNWAFARYMWEKHRPELRKMLTETAAGSVWDPAAGGMRPATVWRPVDAKGILEHYLGMPFAQVEKEYTAFVGQVAFEQFRAQWGA